MLTPKAGAFLPFAEIVYILSFAKAMLAFGAHDADVIFFEKDIDTCRQMNLWSNLL